VELHLRLPYMLECVYRDNFTAAICQINSISGVSSVYGCETWSVTLGEESRPRVFENGVMRMVFGPEKEEVIADCRKQRNEKVHDFCCSKGTCHKHGR